MQISPGLKPENQRLDRHRHRAGGFQDIPQIDEVEIVQCYAVEAEQRILNREVIFENRTDQAG